MTLCTVNMRCPSYRVSSHGRQPGNVKVSAVLPDSTFAENYGVYRITKLKDHEASAGLVYK